MLYIFDLGNVIIDIDFNRALGVWSKLSGVPLATLSQHFGMHEIFQQYERGTLSDEAFARQFSDEMGLSLSFEQFVQGWQAIFIALRPEIIEIMQNLRREGHRVVVLSNNNRLHYHFWSHHYPEVAAAVDQMYLSQDLGMSKPDAEIYHHVLACENFPAEHAVFFDDVKTNVDAAEALGIGGVHVTDRDSIPAYFSR